GNHSQRPCRWSRRSRLPVWHGGCDTISSVQAVGIPGRLPSLERRTTMLHRFAAFVLLPATLFLVAPGLAHAQRMPVPGSGWPPATSNGITGPYVNLESGGPCWVYRMGGTFLFVDEDAQRVPFAYAGPTQLRSVNWGGLRVPNIAVTVGQRADGRIVL